jgi:oligogalacturonide lyase
MNPLPRCAAWAVAGLSLLSPLQAQTPSAPSGDQFPAEYKDPDTGAQILRLSKDLSQPAGVIYFTQFCISPDSRYALVRLLDNAAGHTAGFMYRYDFKTGELLKLTDKITRNQDFVPKSGNLYYTSDNDRAIYVTNIFSLATRKVADMPPDIICSGGLTENADETLVVGTGTLAAEHKNDKVLTTPPNQGSAFTDTFSRHDTNLLIDADIKTGKVSELHRINTWLGHVQFSPTDPNLLMFCHEGPWDKVDRIWLLHTNEDHPQPQLVLKRTEVNEIAGHEFWSADGSTVWYDHNYRNRPGNDFLEGKNLATGKITRYPIKPLFGSIHYTQSPDGKYFVCDGGTRRDPSTQGMYALVPNNGNLTPVKLCNMARNNYKAAEPNPHLTPDEHWAIFTATFSGIPQAYAVAMPKQFWR